MQLRGVLLILSLSLFPLSTCLPLKQFHQSKNLILGSFIYLGYGIKHSTGFMTREEREAYIRSQLQSESNESGPILNYYTPLSHGTMGSTESLARS